MSKVLIFDLGASSGRAVIASLECGKLSINEVHRFSNDPVAVNGTLYWDILRLFHDIKRGIVLANSNGGFESIGIDTWGVDFGLLGTDGALLANPVHYRDARTNDFRQTYEAVSREELYCRTGIQEAQINTVFQLSHLARAMNESLFRAAKLLLIPDLLNYFLTGNISAEYTNATTTGLINLQTRDWDFEIIDRLGVPRKIFPKIVQPGTVHGYLSPALCEELGVPNVPVYNVASHDTASAVVSVPAESENFAYISSGTWSLLGTERNEPLATADSMAHNFSNEGGAEGKICFLTNIMGTWILQECRRHWNRGGANYSFNDLEVMADNHQPGALPIDVDAPEFLSPGNMPQKIAGYCFRKYGLAPDGIGGAVRSILDGLSDKYAARLSELERDTGRLFPALHIIGGGSRSERLCALTAEKIGRPVIAGPTEATVIGNAVAQFIARGEIKDIADGRAVVRASFEVKRYEA